MKANVKKAMAALEALGATVYEGGDNGTYFRISGEHNDPTVFADYYREFGGTDDFGVAHSVNVVLQDNDLYCEWINPGVLGVYDA